MIHRVGIVVSSNELRMGIGNVKRYSKDRLVQLMVNELYDKLTGAVTEEVLDGGRVVRFELEVTVKEKHDPAPLLDPSKFLFVLHPQWVMSMKDGQRHFIDAKKLQELYGVPMGRCVPDMVGREEGPNIIHLYPRYSGDYTEWLVKTVKERTDVKDSTT